MASSALKTVPKAPKEARTAAIRPSVVPAFFEEAQAIRTGGRISRPARRASWAAPWFRRHCPTASQTGTCQCGAAPQCDTSLIIKPGYVHDDETRPRSRAWDIRTARYRACCSPSWAPRTLGGAETAVRIRRRGREEIQGAREARTAAGFEWTVMHLKNTTNGGCCFLKNTKTFKTFRFRIALCGKGLLAVR